MNSKLRGEKMSLSKFEYYAPETVEEACALLEKKAEGAYLMAGGTDLLVKINQRALKPKAIIGLKKVKGIDEIKFDNKNGLTIGAMATLADVASHPIIQKKYPVVAYAASQTANVQIRNMGTVVGNLCNAAPSADNAPTLIVMGAQVIIASQKKERRLFLDEFFRGPGMTALSTGEMVTGILVPPPAPNSGVSYQHFSQRGQVDIAAASVAAMLALRKNICEHVRIVLGAVGPVPLRAMKTEEMIRGKRLSNSLVERASTQASAESKPISDVRASAEYRKSVVAVLTKRALLEAYNRALKTRRE